MGAASTASSRSVRPARRRAGPARSPVGWPRPIPRPCASSTTRTPSSCWRPRSCRPRPPTSGQHRDPGLFDRYPTPAELAVADPAEVEEIIRSTGFYQNKTKSLIGMAIASSSGSTVRSRRRWRTWSPSRESAARPPTWSAAWPSSCPASRSTPTSGGSPAARTDRHDDPVKVELELNSYLPPATRGDFSLRMILHGRRICFAKRPRVRPLLSGGHLSLESAPPPTPSTTGSVRGTPGRLPAGPPVMCIVPTNQVPATWFAATAGIRRLASPERRPLPPGAVAAFSARCVTPVQPGTLTARCRSRSAVRRPARPRRWPSRDPHAVVRRRPASAGDIARRVRQDFRAAAAALSSGRCLASGEPEVESPVGQTLSPTVAVRQTRWRCATTSGRSRATTRRRSTSTCG